MNWIERPVPQHAFMALQQAGLPELLARLLAARGVRHAEETELALHQLLPPADLKGIDAAARLLGQAVTDNLRICVVADYDCDGATACAVAIRGLRAMGAGQLNYVVPDRRVDGYGLTPGIAERVHAQGADVLVTVDNGIASVEGVQAARDLGLQVLVTDHHLPGAELPAAHALVNPNQPGCTFASKHLAGVGVMFYVLLATRAWLRDQGHFGAQGAPALDGLLPLVALGSVADVVTLDANNRRLVHQGLERVRKGRMPAGMAALFEVCGRDPRQCVSLDFGFALAPRINAAGRMSTMGMGIECLLTDDQAKALSLARELDQVNRDRREVESGMLEQALTLAQNHLTADDTAPPALSLFDPQFHEGVIGIVAGRLKDRHHRPAFVFAPAHGQPGQVKGSGRSIPGFHLRDALDALSKRHPNLLLQFGGHAMAAGCTLKQADLPLFGQALQQLASEWLDPNDMNHVWVTDGDLPLSAWNLQDFMALENQVWGSGFAPPLFCTVWRVAEQRQLGDKHLKLKLARGNLEVDGIWFGRTEALPETARLIYKPQINRWRGNLQMQVQIEALVESAAK